MPLAISKVLPASPVHPLPMSLVYTPLASGGLSSYLSTCCLSRPQCQNLCNGASRSGLRWSLLAEYGSVFRGRSHEWRKYEVL